MYWFFLALGFSLVSYAQATNNKPYFIFRVTKINFHEIMSMSFYEKSIVGLMWGPDSCSKHVTCTQYSHLFIFTQLEWIFTSKH